MIYGSVCSGIEAATVAWHPLGWRPAFFSEIDAFPRAALKHHFPHVPLHGDFTTIEEKQYDPIQLLVGGTPCQDFSIAGLRKGLAGDRGNLTLQFLRLAQRLRPQWVVWENVPGVLSDDGGRAFGTILGGLGECGYGVAYRVLDAQFYGVAQRRRRVFVVGYLGDWRPPAAVLFDSESLSGNPPPRREAGQDAAPTLDCRAGRSGETTFATSGGLVPVGFETSPQGGKLTDLAGTLDASCKDGPIRNQLGNGVIETFRMQSFGEYEADGTARTIKERDHKDATDLIVFDSKGSQVYSRTDDCAPTLRSMGHSKSHMNGGGQLAVAYDITFCDANGTRKDRPNGGLYVNETATSKTLTAEGDISTYIAQKLAVRRLTPRECERLQGFPDEWTLVPFGKSLATDGHRYKALGNSMAVPVMAKLGARIDLINKLMEQP